MTLMILLAIFLITGIPTTIWLFSIMQAVILVIVLLLNLSFAIDRQVHHPSIEKRIK